MKSLHSRFTLFVILGMLFCFSSCQKDSPDTLVHVDQNEFNAEDRSIIGTELNRIIETNTNLFQVLDPSASANNMALHDYLETVFISLVNTEVVEHRNTLDWGVSILVDDESSNAFITPGGTFYITTKLLKFIESEHELIGIMGHEIMYADSDLLLNRLKSEYGGDILGDIILGNNPSEAVDIANELKNLQYSESEVLEADAFSIDIICDFLYDPHGMRDFLNRVVADGEQMTWTQNRPSSEDRIIIIQQNAGGCGPGSTHADRYHYFISKLP